MSITVDQPIIGKTAAECKPVPEIVTTPANSFELVAEESTWFNLTGIGAFTGTFEEGKKYIYEICLKAKDGYRFPQTGGDFAGTAQKG